MVADGWGELMDDEEEEEKSEDASDFGGGRNGSREDALWSDETNTEGWESVREEVGLVLGA